MLITGFPAGVFQTNCYVLAEGPGADAVIVDPGQDAVESVKALLAEHRLNPVAVLLTHGHLDHTWTAQPLADEFGIPVYIHAADRPMLADPAVGIGPALGSMIGGQIFTEPEKVIELDDGEAVTLAGITFGVDLAPGHTRGSIVFTTEVPQIDEAGEPVGAEPVIVAFSGDVLFQGSIGRTDLPGGSHEQLLDSIAAKLLPLPDETVVLPGHGPATTIGQERASNPFLQGLTGAQAPGERKGRFGL
ncbi:Beta-lactamase domain protein OS=Tsukamurella paurometabola (strain ATCC 8368 / DSM / CCUG 35730/ CIP 100753 / JCM 10117 / KCTC 9821 / NBRC 16120 / NCIMB 702349 / NCTC 13040) OX=521096 GN=Tpau_1949 PE=4 SV=1 [Tsukamurella paurometabola]|uniref:Beta-lactamase domain protein n=1 Tax=Tsukamurella paurometabola (strain ATCC 8368 / DSM 20162 / CCUG 35730 / CIP 100753 / JCM 10117 / KCTC 9821 / NBRC 16120 / NCIMB 702349 / NCTC 13040) TaxID=521096 RepID=D5UNJ3_TSUPD|nr:MBL fold metallo-hydrolase [Tsukamurella paurometabola]ADG78561.1 beta-lactamase domain protein [Tsukamurella paurometabola DSM 20162]SUP32192.1 hydroxyacylglutathione hydrolase [Tsukamurella paurometabola]